MTEQQLEKMNDRAHELLHLSSQLLGEAVSKRDTAGAERALLMATVADDVFDLLQAGSPPAETP